jgi:hypothetical protein
VQRGVAGGAREAGGAGVAGGRGRAGAGRGEVGRGDVGPREEEEEEALSTVYDEWQKSPSFGR